MATNKRFKDLVGQRFGRLTVVKFYGKDKHSHNLWLCKCDCGNEKIVATSDFKRTNSCGCLARELTVKRNTTHGKTHDRLYRVYNHIKDRCYRKTSRGYPYYGARGIKMCEEWLNYFTKFYEWATNNGYKDGLTIDRIDVNSDYTPENCRWVGWVTQQNNKQNTIWITYNDITQSLAQWCKELNINYLHAYHEYRKGTPIELIFK